MHSENSKSPIMVIGGQAVLLYGEPRLTRDIDVTLGVGVDHLNAIEGVVKKLGFQPLAPDTAFIT